MSFPHTIADGRYTLVEPLGVGGMATVFKAFDQRLQIWRAVKILNAQYSNRPSLRDRFEAEARTTALLEHKHIVKVYDVGRTNGQPFIVMELVQGGNLVDWVKRHGPMPPRLSAVVTCQVCEGVAAAHAHKVIHRDIKPHNVLITSKGTCLITDFGIARVGDESDGLTRTGAVFGTWAYMAPEQRNDAKKVDRRADVYSLAASLYFLLTGRTPVDLFAAEKDPSVLEGIDSVIAPVLVKATQYARTDRFATVEELRDALQAILDDIPPDPPNTPPLAGELPAPDLLRNGTRAVVDSAGGITLMPDGEVVSSGVTMVPGPGVDDSLVFETPEGKVLNLRNIADLVAAGILLAPEPPPRAAPKDAQGFLPLVTSMPPEEGLPEPQPAPVVESTPVEEPSEPPITDVPEPDELGPVVVPKTEVDDVEDDDEEEDALARPFRFALGLLAGVIVVLLVLLVVRWTSKPDAVDPVPAKVGEVTPPAPDPALPQPSPTPPLPDPPIPTPPDPNPSVNQGATTPPVPLPDPPPPPKGTLRLAGEAKRVELHRDQKTYAPGKLSPGTYKVWADFGDGVLVPVGEVKVVEGRTVTLECIARFRSCKPI